MTEEVPIKEHVDSLLAQFPARVTIKDYFEALLKEKDRALEMAESERQKSAEVLRDLQSRALEQAEREREKAAQILRESLMHQIASGDAALEGHISEQVRQIRTIIEMGSEQVAAAFAASEKAISKAEVANEKRFEAVNEFRGQLADQTKSFLPRETFDAFVTAFSEYKESTNRALILREGSSRGSANTIAYIFAGVGFFGTAIGIILVLGDVLTA